jgi:NADH dehydrogenase FAD-containing subunit
LTKPGLVGKRVIVIGGGMIGCETAEQLSNSEYEVICRGLDSDGSLIIWKRKKKTTGKARRVTIISSSNEIAQDCEAFSRMLLIQRLKVKNIDIFTRARVEKLTKRGLRFSNHTRKKKFIPCDTIVVARQPLPQSYLKRKLEKKGFVVKPIGDCIHMGGIPNAIHTGYNAGNTI